MIQDVQQDNNASQKEDEDQHREAQELEQQDQALTSLFLGTTVRDTTEHVLWVTPDGAFPRQVFFRLSQVHGLVEADDLSGAPYYISIDDITQLPAPEENPKAKKKKFCNNTMTNCRPRFLRNLTNLQPIRIFMMLVKISKRLCLCLKKPDMILLMVK